MDQGRQSVEIEEQEEQLLIQLAEQNGKAYGDMVRQYAALATVLNVYKTAVKQTLFDLTYLLEHVPLSDPSEVIIKGTVRSLKKLQQEKGRLSVASVSPEMSDWIMSQLTD